MTLLASGRCAARFAPARNGGRDRLSDPAWSLRAGRRSGGNRGRRNRKKAGRGACNGPVKNPVTMIGRAALNSNNSLHIRAGRHSPGAPCMSPAMASNCARWPASSSRSSGRFTLCGRAKTRKGLVAIGQAQEFIKPARPRTGDARSSSSRTNSVRSGGKPGQFLQDHAVHLGPVPADALELREAAESARRRRCPGGAAATNISFPAAARAAGIVVMRLQDRRWSGRRNIRRPACGNRSSPLCGRRAPDGRSAPWETAAARSGISQDSLLEESPQCAASL